MYIGDPKKSLVIPIAFLQAGISLEPLFYRGRGITASDPVFTIIWRGFSVFPRQKKICFCFFKIIFTYICSCTTILTLVAGWHGSKVSRSE